MHRDEFATTHADILHQAIAWHLAQSDMPADRWEMFVAWIEADAAHARVYDHVASADRMIADARFPVVAANDDAPFVGLRRWPFAIGGFAIGGGAVAAALLAAVLLPFALPAPSTSFDIATRPGEHRTVRLVDGTVAELSGDTILKLDRARPRQAELAQGEATLHVTHDASAPFTITSRGLTVQDVGTVFDLTRVGDRLSIAVEEGAVMIEPQREAVTLQRGDALLVRDRDHVMLRSTIDPAAVGGWRSGLLSFNAEPLTGVAASLYRREAVRVEWEGPLSYQPFTGIVRLTGRADRDVPHLAAMIGATWRRDGERWVLASNGAPR